MRQYSHMVLGRHLSEAIISLVRMKGDMKTYMSLRILLNCFASSGPRISMSSMAKGALDENE